MPQQLATLVYVLGIIGLFYLARDRGAYKSTALWIPTLWLLIVSSRPVSVWLQSGPTFDSREAYVDGSPLDAAVFGILLVAGTIVLSQRIKRTVSILRTNMPVLLFFAYCLLSVAWSEYPVVAFKRWIKAIGDLTMVLIVITDSDVLAAVRQVLTRVSFILVPMSLLFIKYYPDLGRSYNQWTWTPVYSGVTLGKNLLGMTCLICGIGSLWCFLAASQKPKGRQRSQHMIAYGVVVVMATYLILAADSMTSFSCLVLAGGMLFITRSKSSTIKMNRVHLSVAVVIFIAAFALFVDTQGHLIKSLGREPTLTGRTLVWDAALNEVQHPLIGAGFEGFWLGNRLLRIWEAISQPGIQEAHNGYLEVYLNLGWIGVSLVALLIISGYRKVLATLRRDALMGRFLLAFFVAGVVYNFTEAGFRMMAPVWIFFLFAITSDPERGRAMAEIPVAEISAKPATTAIRKPIDERAF